MPTAPPGRERPLDAEPVEDRGHGDFEVLDPTCRGLDRAERTVGDENVVAQRIALAVADGRAV